MAQLQEFLSRSGYRVDRSGTYGTRTRAAVRAWSAKLGLRADSVPLGRVLFLPRLPVTVIPADGTRLGSALPSPALKILSSSPSLIAKVPEGQAANLRPGLGARVVLEDRTAETTVTRIEVAAGTPGLLALVLDAGPFKCTKTNCPRAEDGNTIVNGSIVVQPKVTGLVLPVSAIATDAAGRHWVKLRSGELCPVELGSAADGQVIVEGLAEGDVVSLVT